MGQDTNSIEYIGKYRILEEIGRGGMGVVYKGLDPYIERTVAIKTISVEVADEDKEQEKWKSRFLREAQLAGNLNHPNIATVYDVGEDSGILYIAMEFIDGKSLREVMNSPERLSFEQIHNYLLQICDAMSYAHQKGVIHCDLKAGNILIDRAGKIVIVDFGIARRSTSQNVTQTVALMVSPSSSAPERISGEDPCPASDIFSLGTIFYEMVTGQKPFPGDDITTVIKKILYDDPPSPTSVNDSLPQEINQILGKALAKDPEDRYQSCEEFMGDILRYNVLPINQGAVNTIVLDQKTVSHAPRRRQQKFSKRVALPISILFVLIILASFSYYILKNKPGKDADTPVTSSVGMKEDNTATRPTTDLMITGDHVLLGKQSLQRHDYGGAIENFERAIEQDPENYELHYLLGLAYQNQSLYDGSISEYKKAIALERSFAPPYKGLAEVYEQREEMKEAISYYEDYTDLIFDSRDIEQIKDKIDSLQAQVLQQENRIETVSMLFQKGKEYYTQGRYDDAIRELEECISIDPNQQEVQKFLEMAQSQEEIKRLEDIREFSTKGEEYFENQAYSQAIYYFNKVLELDPDHADARRQVELAKEHIRREQEVKRYYSKGLQSMDRGNYTQAGSYFEKVLSLTPDHNDAKKQLTIAKRAAKKKKRIDEYLSAGIEFLDQKDYSQAIHSFKEVLALDADNLRAKDCLQQAERQQRIVEYLSKGIASLDREDYSQAIGYFNNVLKLDPEHRDAKQYLEMSQLKKMEEKLGEQVDIPTDAQGDAKLPKGW